MCADASIDCFDMPYDIIFWIIQVRHNTELHGQVFELRKLLVEESDLPKSRRAGQG